MDKLSQFINESSGRTTYSRENFSKALMGPEILTYIGFRGFRNKVVADIGSRDGRNIPIFLMLGQEKFMLSSQIYSQHPKY